MKEDRIELARTYTIEDMKQAFTGGKEWIWEDMEQTSTCPKYDSFEEWFKQWRHITSITTGTRPVVSARKYS